MTNIRIKTELRKECTHLSGLKGDIIKIIQQSTSGIIKLPTCISSPTNRSHQFKEAIKELVDSTLKRRPKTKIFSHIEYLKGGQVSFSLSPEAKDIWNKKAFYRIDFDIYTSYSSKFAKGLYELLCAFEGAKIKMNIKNVQEWLYATDSDYLKPSRFIQRVLKPAIEEVEAKSGIKTQFNFDINGYLLSINAEFPPSKANLAIKNNSLFLSMGRLGIPIKWRRLAIRELGEVITKQLIDNVQYEMSDVPQKDRKKVCKQRIINRIMAALGIEKQPKLKRKKAAQPNVKESAKTTKKQPTKVKPMPNRQLITYDRPYSQSIGQLCEQFITPAIC